MPEKPLNDSPAMTCGEGDSVLFHNGEALRLRRLVRTLSAGVILAVVFELSGRVLYHVWDAPYGLTGTLTLLAILAWGGVSVYVIRSLYVTPRISRTVSFGAAFLALSQIKSLVVHLEAPFLGRLLTRIDPFGIVYEEGFFLLGLALLFSGFYMSFFEIYRANARNERRRQLLASEVEERHRAQLEIKRGEQTMAAVFAANPESMLLLDLDYQIVMVNEVAARRLNTQPQNLVGKNIANIIPESVAERRRTPFEQARVSKVPIGFEDIRDGRHYFIYIYPIFDEHGERYGFAVMGIDVTERRQMEEELRRLNEDLEVRVQERTQELTVSNLQLQGEISERIGAEQKLADALAFNQTLIAASPVGIAVYGESGHCILVNRAMSAFAEARPEELLGQHIQEHALLRESGVLPLAEGVLDTGESRSGAAHLMMASGREKWFEYHLTLFHSGGEKHLLSIVEDISKRVRNEQVITDQRFKMEHAARMAAVGTMAGGIAHEIKNPLAVISAGAQRMEFYFRGHDEEGMQLHRAAETIVRNVDRIDNIVRALQSLSRESAGDQFYQMQVKRIVADAVELCQYRFRKGGITLDINDIGDTELMCRPSQLSQVLLNLLNNAYDAVEPLPEKWIKLNVSEDAGMVEFRITDSGPGIPAVQQDDIFVPFYTTKKEGMGIGLGLSISQKIVEAHNGELRLDANNPNTCFVVRIPKGQTPSPVQLSQEGDF